MSWLDKFFNSRNYGTIQNNGVPLPPETILNIIGADSIVDDPTGLRTTVTVTGGGGFTAGNNLSGSSSSQVVIKINGAAVSAAGALTTGNSLYVSGVATLTYSALNLAGGSGWVTGLLPEANQVDQTMGGDVSGPTATAVVEKIKGTTITTAGGALAIGGVLRTTAGGVADWGPLDLADADARTGILPVANGGTGLSAQGTALYLLRVNAAGNAYEHVAPSSGTPGGSDTQVQFNDGGVLGGDAGFLFDKTSNYATLTGGLKLGASGWADAGLVQLADAAGIIMAVRNAGGTANKEIISATTSNLVFGDAAAVWGSVALKGGSGTSAYVQGYNVELYAYNALGIKIDAVSGYGLHVSDTSIKAGVPIIGDAARASSPYGVHGVGVQAMGDANQTLSASVYCYATWKFTSTTQVLDRTATIPAATDAAAYTRDIDNAIVGDGSSGLASVILTTGAGTTVPFLAGERGRILVDSRGVTRIDRSGPAGMVVIALTDPTTSYYLTAAQFANGRIRFTGDPGGSCTVYVPTPQSTGQSFLRTFDCSGMTMSENQITITPKYNTITSTSVTVTDGNVRGVWLDATAGAIFAEITGV